MISQQQYNEKKAVALSYLEKAGIAITPEEQERIEVADFGLNDIDNTGLQVITYINTDRVCSKELVLTPHQTCPEHRHPDRGNEPGKEETFRCRMGEVYLYVEGTPAANPVCRPPKGSEQYYHVFHEIKLLPGGQYTLRPNTLHWFQAGDDGCVVSEFSTNSDDAGDVFTDPNIKRIPEVK